jgi:hypothetical protein
METVRLKVFAAVLFLVGNFRCVSEEVAFYVNFCTTSNDY